MKYKNDGNPYGDEDVPEADYRPYEDNSFEPHPQADGENKEHLPKAD